MNILSPSILAADFTILGQQIMQVDQGGAKYLHIDVMDGVFVPSISYGMCVIASIRKVTDIIFDVHLMITDPIRYVEEFAKAGADLITVHLEACEDVGKTIEAIHALGIKVGLSIKPNTKLETLIPYLDKVDMILLMTVEPGFGGQTYIDSSTNKIKELRKMLTDRNLNIDIEVDGGITKENLPMVVQAGANVIVAGSAIFKGEIQKNTEDFIRIMNESNK